VDSRGNVLGGVPITPTTPLRLKVAAALAFPDGSMSEKALRELGHAGKLTVEIIRGKHFNTLADIEEMRSLRRVQARVPDSTSRQRGRDTKPVTSSATSSTDDGSSCPAQVAARQILRRRSGSSAAHGDLVVSAGWCPVSRLKTSATIVASRSTSFVGSTSTTSRAATILCYWRLAASVGPEQP
jgi:hypothetical protein